MNRRASKDLYYKDPINKKLKSLNTMRLQCEKEGRLEQAAKYAQKIHELKILKARRTLEKLEAERSNF